MKQGNNIDIKYTYIYIFNLDQNPPVDQFALQMDYTGLVPRQILIGKPS